MSGVPVPLWRRLGLFLTGSMVAQGLAALSGLLLARWMSVEDYGAYTIVTIVMGAISVLTKGGAHLGYTAILGRTWPDMARAAEAVAAVLRMRRLISLVVMPCILAATWFLLRRNGVNLGSTAVVLALLTMFWWADMRTRLIDQILAFAKQTTRVQTLDVALAQLRLGAVVGLYWADLLSLPTAVALGVSVALLRVRPILAWVRGLLPPGPPPEPRSADLAEMRTSVRRQMPVEIYYVLQAQLILVVLSVFGSVADIAGYGALTRINQLLMPVEALTYAFLVPMFSRRSPERALRLYLPLVMLTMLPGALLVLVSLVFPEGLLWLIGPNYAGLQEEIFVAALMAMLVRGAGTAWSLLAHRGWVQFSWVQIPVGLSCCALAPFLLDLGNLKEALLLQLASAAGWLAAAALDYWAAHRERKLKS